MKRTTNANGLGARVALLLAALAASAQLMGGVTVSGVTVGGADVVQGAGDGWTFADGVLSLAKAQSYVLAGTNTAGAVRVEVTAGADVTLDNLKLTGLGTTNVLTFATGATDATLTLVGANTVYATNDIAGVCILEGATVTLSGDGALVGGRAVSERGRGVTVHGTLTMDGGTVRDYFGRDCAGGLYVGETGVVTMNGGSITNNEVHGFGGGVNVRGTFTMNGGAISGNLASNNDGGGIWNSGTTVVNGGVIANNTANNFGGAVLQDSGSFTLNGGEITGNGVTKPSLFWRSGTAFGVYGGDLVVRGGWIHDNHATSTESYSVSAHIEASTDYANVSVYGGVFSEAECYFDCYKSDIATIHLYGCECPTWLTDHIAAGYEAQFVGEAKSGWYVIAQRGTVACTADGLTAGTYTFDPTRAEYAAAGVAVADARVIHTADTTPRTYAIGGEPTGVTVNGMDAGAGGGSNPSWTYADNVLRLTQTDGCYTLKGTGEELGVEVQADGIVLTIENLLLYNRTGLAPIAVGEHAATILLKGRNTLVASCNRAAVEVYGTGSVTIDAAPSETEATAYLYAYSASSDSASAAIGCRDGTASGTVTINGGTINAYGAVDVADIGGVRNGQAPSVTINGGRVTCYAFGLGQGNNGTGGAFTMTGGTLDAPKVGTASASVTGGSLELDEPSSVGGKLDGRHLVTVTLNGRHPDNVAVSWSSATTYGGNDLYPIDNRLFLWLPDGEHDFNIDGLPYEATVNGADTAAEPILPPAADKTISAADWRELETLAKNGYRSISLTADCRVDGEPVTITNAVTVDLGGHVVSNVSANGRLFDIGEGGALTLVGSGTYAGDGTSFGEHGAFAAVRSGGSLEIRDAVTIENFRTDAGHRGGAFLVAGGALTVKGGTILGCAAGEGGAGYVESGTAVVTGGTVRGCRSTGKAGAFYVATGGQMTVDGGVFVDNVSEDPAACGFYAADGCSFRLNGGIVSGKEAEADFLSACLPDGYGLHRVDGVSEDCYIVGQNVITTSGQIVSGVLRFDPRTAEYAALGLSVAPDLVLGDDGSGAYAVLTGVTVGGTDAVQGAGDGWRYVYATKTLTLDNPDATYELGGGGATGIVRVVVAANAKVVLAELKLASAAPMTVAGGVYATVETRGACSLVATASGTPAICAEAGATVRFATPDADAVLEATGGDGAAAVGGLAGGSFTNVIAGGVVRAATLGGAGDEAKACAVLLMSGGALDGEIAASAASDVSGGLFSRPVPDDCLRAGFGCAPLDDTGWYVVGTNVQTRAGVITGGGFVFDVTDDFYVRLGVRLGEGLCCVYDAASGLYVVKSDVYVNGVNLSRLDGIGWTFDITTHTLTVTNDGEFSVSGVSTNEFLQRIVVTANANLTLDRLTLTPTADSDSGYDGNVIVFGPTATNATLTLVGGNTVYARVLKTDRAAVRVYEGAKVTVVGTGSLRGTPGVTTGRGVLVEGALVMNGGTISSYSTDGNGGAVCNNGSLTVNGGTISGCSANKGGALFNSGTASICGGAMTNNAACSSGGFCYCNTDCHTDIYGGVFAADPTAEDESSGCLVLQDGAEVTQVGALYVVGRDVTHEGNVLTGGTYSFDPSLGEYAAAGLRLPSGAKVCPIGQNQGYELLADGDQHHCVCGRRDCDEHDESNLAWTAVSSLPSASGAYFLTADVTLTEPWEVPEDGTVYLCLNGHVVTSADGAPLTQVCRVGSGARLVLTDCQPASGALSEGDAGVEVGSGGEFALFNGRIRENGHGVKLTGGALFTMVGGRVSENRCTDENGAGVLVEGAGNAVRLSGGEISDNAAENGLGGGLYLAAGNALTNDAAAVVSGNKAKSGGGLHTSGDVRLDGLVVSENIADDGAGVTVAGGRLSFDAGDISENVASAAGGAFLVTGGELTVNGGRILDNKAGRGVIVCASGGETRVYGGVESGNVSARGYDFEQDADGRIEVVGTVSDRRVDAHLADGVASYQIEKTECWLVARSPTSVRGELTGGFFAFDPSDPLYREAGLAVADLHQVVRVGLHAHAVVPKGYSAADYDALSAYGDRQDGIAFHGFLYDEKKKRYYPPNTVINLNFKLYSSAHADAELLWARKIPVTIDENGGFYVDIADAVGVAVQSVDGETPACKTLAAALSRHSDGEEGPVWLAYVPVDAKLAVEFPRVPLYFQQIARLASTAKNVKYASATSLSAASFSSVGGAEVHVGTLSTVTPVMSLRNMTVDMPDKAVDLNPAGSVKLMGLTGLHAANVGQNAVDLPDVADSDCGRVVRHTLANGRTTYATVYYSKGESTAAPEGATTVYVWSFGSVKGND